VTTDQCICLNNYTGVICQLPPGEVLCSNNSGCVQTDLCKNSTFAINAACVNFTCVFTDVPCDDGNICTDEVCDPSLGCVRTNKSCNDNNQCTNDFCNTTDGSCYYTDACLNSNLTDACGKGICDNATQQCIKQPIKCPKKNNCTYTPCINNLTYKGCINITLDCHSNLGIIIGTISAGIIAAIVIALAILCLAICSGGAYAVVQTVQSSTEASVFVNPLHVGAGKDGNNPLFNL